MVSTYSDPVALFTAAVDALNQEDWAGVAGLCDPISLTAFKRNLMDNLSPPAKETHKLTAAELMKAVPSMPRAVAEYQMTRFRESLDPKQRLRDQVPGVKSREVLETMEAAGVFAAWLEGKSLRRQLGRDVELKRMSRATANEVLAQGTKHFNFEGLGFVRDGERLVHVVYRRDAVFRGPFPGNDDPWVARCSAAERELMRDLWGREHTLSVMARRQSDDSWLLVADSDFLLVGQIGLGFSGEPEL